AVSEHCDTERFPDIGPDSAFCEEITWLADSGIARGYGDCTFRPSAALTRQAMAAYIYRMVEGAEPPEACVPPEPTPMIGSCPVFPADNYWNTDISQLPVHSRSDDWVSSIGENHDLHPDFGTFWNDAPIGIPFVTVDAGQPEVPISFYYA